MRKRVLVPIATGSEEIEAVCVIDTLRRAQAEVTVASVEDKLLVTCSRGTKLEADALLKDLEGQTFDLIALPGGMPGAKHLADSHALTHMLKQQHAAGRLIGAVCAAPSVVLAHHGLLKRHPDHHKDDHGEACHEATAHPAHSAKLPNQSKVEERVVVSDNIITSRGPGTSLEWSLKLVEALFGKEEAGKHETAMLIQTH